MSIKFSTKIIKELQIGWPVCQWEDNRELKCRLWCNSVDCTYILRTGCYENGNQSSGSITRISLATISVLIRISLHGFSAFFKTSIIHSCYKFVHLTSFWFNEVHVEVYVYYVTTPQQFARCAQKAAHVFVKGTLVTLRRVGSVWEPAMSSTLETSLKGQPIGLLIRTALNNRHFVAVQIVSFN
jgi:hypothetical protein